jgi:hypothetical protein
LGAAAGTDCYAASTLRRCGFDAKKRGKSRLEKYFLAKGIGDALVPALWIRIGLNANPDSAFYLSADPDTDPDLDPGSQTNADPGGSGSGSGQTFKSQKVEFLHKNVFKVGMVIGEKHTYEGTKAF